MVGARLLPLVTRCLCTQDYLESFCSSQNLQDSIRLQTRVTDVCRQDDQHWAVTSASVKGEGAAASTGSSTGSRSSTSSSEDVSGVQGGGAAATTTGLYNAVVVANGHYHLPSYPAELQATLSLFKGTHFHAAEYDAHCLDTLRDKSVCIVGARYVCTLHVYVYLYVCVRVRVYICVCVCVCVCVCARACH